MHMYIHLPVVGSGPVGFAAACVDPGVSGLDEVKASAEIQDGLISILNHNIAYDVDEFNNKPSKTIFVGLHVCVVGWKYRPVDPYRIFGGQ